MSKGSKVVLVRIPPELLAEAEAALTRHNQHARELWTMSDFVRDCLRERVDKRERRKKSKAGKREKGGEAC